MVYRSLPEEATLPILPPAMLHRLAPFAPLFAHRVWRHALVLVAGALLTLMLQEVLAAPTWADRLGPADLRALTPLLYGHVNPYGTFQLDMTTRLALAQSA